MITKILYLFINVFRRTNKLSCRIYITVILMVIKLKIGQLIKERGLKQRYVAKEIGVNENTIVNWIRGRSIPRLDKAILLAELLDCKITDLYDRI